MIDFKYWLSQIAGYCALVADNDKLYRAWVDRDSSITSVTDFDELYEQVFDDLDSDSMELSLPSHLGEDPEVCSAVSAFLDAIRKVDDARSKEPCIRRSDKLLQSALWADLKSKADRAQVALASRKP